MTSDSMTKAEAVAKVATLPENKRDQKAIVDLVMGRGKIDKRVHEIPGGSYLLDPERGQSIEKLPSTVFNWLRLTVNFERWEVCFAGDYTDLADLEAKGIKVSKRKVVDFGYKAGFMPYWLTKGLRSTADAVAKVLAETNNLVAIAVEKEGIFAIVTTERDEEKKFSSSSEHWCPVLITHKTIK
jgi:hypothetical protein